MKIRAKLFLDNYFVARNSLLPTVIKPILHVAALEFVLLTLAEM